MKYLFIGAHQDDIEFSCGGTLLKLIDEGHEVHIVVMSNGASSLNGTSEERNAEQKAASEFAKVTSLVTLDHDDGAIDLNGQTIAEMSYVISKINPDVVVTHYPEDTHQDHRNVAAMVKSATRRKYSLAYYDSYSSRSFSPNLFVDVSRYIDKKKEMLNLFKSQIEKYNERGTDFVEMSILIAKLNGYECKSHYAEGFAIDTYWT